MLVYGINRLTEVVIDSLAPLLIELNGHMEATWHWGSTAQALLLHRRQNSGTRRCLSVLELTAQLALLKHQPPSEQNTQYGGEKKNVFFFSRSYQARGSRVDSQRLLVRLKRWLSVSAREPARASDSQSVIKFTKCYYINSPASARWKISPQECSQPFCY